MVSSTAIPNTIANTIATPLSNSIPAKPINAAAIISGKTLGIKEIITILQLLNIKPINKLTINIAKPKPDKIESRIYSSFLSKRIPVPVRLNCTIVESIFNATHWSIYGAQ